jgi:hypothetical protein
VWFFPEPYKPDARSWWFVTDDAGKFVCSTNVAGDGLPPGRYLVAVTWPEELQTEPEVEIDRLRGRYANPTRSRLRAEVKTGPNQLPPFQLQ